MEPGRHSSGSMLKPIIEALLLGRLLSASIIVRPGALGGSAGAWRDLARGLGDDLLVVVVAGACC